MTPGQQFTLFGVVAVADVGHDLHVPVPTEISSNGRDDLTVKCRSLAGWLGGECQSRRSMDDSVE